MGWLAVVAGLLFGIALVFLTAFFITKDARFDRVAEWAFVAFAVATIPVMPVVAGRLVTEGLAVPLVTAVGIAGVVTVGLAQLGIALKIVDFRRVSALVTVGFLVYLAWIGGASALIVTDGGLPVGLGWLGLASIAVGAAVVLWMARVPGVITGAREPDATHMVLFVVPTIGIVAWSLWLGLSI